MSTQQATLDFTADRIQAHRETKRALIEKYFTDHIGEVLSSRTCHIKWGSSFRTRVSEINRNVWGEIRILNEVIFAEGQEQSAYWAVRR